MAITVKIPAQLRPATGGEGEIQVESAATVGDALDAVFAQHDGLRERITEDGDLRRFVNVYVAGEDIRFQDGLETAVADGAEVTILPAVAGGSNAAGPPAREEPVAILCGGRGTRLQEHTHAIPKALVEIGGRPILWHVLQIYAAHGFRRFLLLCGYRGEMIAEFASRADLPEGVEIECIDTGTDTPTGGRVARAAEQLSGGTFALTYADGVADVDLSAALSFHRDHGSAATVTLVRPRSQWGVATIGADGSSVTGFVEKPRMERWVNGGFLFCEPQVLDYVAPDSVFEHGPLERLAGAGELRGWSHEGFWDCMDTYKDAVVLNDLWATGSPPWRVWEDVPAPTPG